MMSSVRVIAEYPQMRKSRYAAAPLLEIARSLIGEPAGHNPRVIINGL